MSNKGSIEKDIKNIKQYINLVLDKGYCDCNELNVISTGKYCDGSKNVAYSMQNILAEREQMLKAINTVEKEKGEWIEECVQKDKRIQELEEEKNACENEIQIHLNAIKEYYKKVKNDYIPKQVVIDKLERHKFAYEELSKDYEDDRIRARDFYKIVTEDRIVQVLQEILKEG